MTDEWTEERQQQILEIQKQSHERSMKYHDWSVATAERDCDIEEGTLQDWMNDYAYQEYIEDE